MGTEVTDLTSSPTEVSFVPIPLNFVYVGIRKEGVSGWRGHSSGARKSRPTRHDDNRESEKIIRRNKYKFSGTDQVGLPSPRHLRQSKGFSPRKIVTGIFLRASDFH